MRRSLFSLGRAFLLRSVPVFLVLCLLGLFTPLQKGEATHRPNDAPRIANWDFAWSIDSDREAEKLAEWDVLIIDIENEYYSRDRLKLIKELNPEIVLLAYISPVDIRPDAATLDTGTSRRYIGEQLEQHPEWLLYLASQEQAEWWPAYDIMNITSAGKTGDGKLFVDFFARFVRDAVVKDNLWDGIFFDNLWENITFVSDEIDLDRDGVAESEEEANRAWRQGITRLLRKTRKNAQQYRASFLIAGNGGTRYYRYLNGVGFEHFPNTIYGGWTASMEEYFFTMRYAERDRYGVINTNVGNSGKRKNYRKFRYGLTSTLLNDGYYSFDNGDFTHHERWYYDEYDALLGEPVSGAYNMLEPQSPTTLEEGLWRRDYESASVLVNSTAEPQAVDLQVGFEKFRGTQDPETNSGEVIGEVTIPAHDGLILLPRLTQVRDATFINGAFSKVFDQNGSEVRSSFFSYDGSFDGGVQIHKVSSRKRTVVADETFVRVYDQNNVELASFAPYGESFSGGVNIAVGSLYGDDDISIVTGTQSSSPQVRIFNLDGQLVNPGCFPYAKEFQGGVNVAIGDVNGDGRMEIIVAAGVGGGPHIRILNNYCEVINPGFFAFDERLRIGVNMAVGDLDGDGNAEIIAAPGPGGGPHVRIFNSRGKLLASGFFAYDEDDRSGVLVSTADINEDGRDEIVTSSFSIFQTLGL